MAQAATLEEPKPVAQISDLSVLVASVPKLHLDIIEEARKAAKGEYPGVACDGLGKVPDLPAIARGEPPHEVIEAAWEKIQRIETIVSASGQIITGLGDDSARFNDIRIAIRDAVHRVREYGRATINEVRSLNRVDLNVNAVHAAAFKALEESAERLGELSQVPLRATPPVVASEVVDPKRAMTVEDEPDQAAAEIAAAADATPKVDPQSRAMAILTRNPELTNLKIAEMVEVHPSTLYRWDSFNVLRKALKATPPGVTRQGSRTVDRDTDHVTHEVWSTDQRICTRCKDPFTPEDDGEYCTDCRLELDL